MLATCYSHTTGTMTSMLLWLTPAHLHTHDTIDSAQATGIWQCKWTVTNNFTLIFPALSHHHSNFSDCNVHGGVPSKWFLGFDTSQPKISCKGYGSTKKKLTLKKPPWKPIPLCVENIAIAEQLHPCQVLWKVSLLTDKFIWYVS